MSTDEAMARAAERAAKKRARLEQADREITALDAARAAIEAHRLADEAAAIDVIELDAAADAAVDALVSALGGSVCSDARRESLRRAIALRADAKAVRRLAAATRLHRSVTVNLPRGKYKHLSRGRDWCRRSDGTFSDDFRVGPGRWTVGSTDGFSRKSREEWVVSHIQVGDETWTIAV